MDYIRRNSNSCNNQGKKNHGNYPKKNYGNTEKLWNASPIFGNVRGFNPNLV